MGIGLNIILGVAAVFILIYIVHYAIMLYNGLVKLKNNRLKAYSNIDVLLNQRNDEIPNLVATVQGYKIHEENVLVEITKARSDLMNAKNMKSTTQADMVLSTGLKSLFAVVENYPELKASENFLKLQKRITGLENEIADRRELYNDATTILNTKIEVVPDFIFAIILGLKRQPLFKISSSQKSVPDLSKNI